MILAQSGVPYHDAMNMKRHELLAAYITVMEHPANGMRKPATFDWDQMRFLDHG